MSQQLVDTATEGERVFAALAPEGAVPPWEAIADLAPALGAQVRQGLGAIMARPQLDLRTRELATVCMLAALGGCEPQLQFHVGGALRAGATPGEVIEAISQVYLYAGFPRTLNALQVARKVLES
jgi:4-carboxymuconolactone decarboxylase